jgi:hypothetical protein
MCYPDTPPDQPGPCPDDGPIDPQPEGPPPENPDWQGGHEYEGA